MILVILSAVLILLILVICGDKGARSIVSTVFSGLLLIATLFLINRGAPVIFTVFAACLISAAGTLFYQNERDPKAKSAFLSVLLVLAITLPLVFYFAGLADAAGFNNEQYELTDSNGYTRNIGLSMVSLEIAVMLIALLGTAVDTAVAVTSSVYEILSAEPSMPASEFTKRAFRVGTAIMNTSIHTIFYVYLAEFTTLLIQYADDVSFAYVLNSKSLASELISVCVSGIGCCLVVPVAIFVARHFFLQDDKKSSHAGEDTPSI